MPGAWAAAHASIAAFCCLAGTMKKDCEQALKDCRYSMSIKSDNSFALARCGSLVMI
jgi:hypothetical protein